MADIFEEVDEELKEENFKKLWDRFGLYIMAAIFLILAGTGAYLGWRSYTLDRQKEFSERFEAAISFEAQDKNVDAAAVLTVLAADASDGYAMLARFREAAARREEGDTAAAIDIYDALAAEDSIDEIYQDYAVLLSVMMQADTGDAAQLSERLAPLVESGPWRYTAGEYLGLFALKQGDTAGARKRFETIADDREAPEGARTRAAELLQTLDQ